MSYLEAAVVVYLRRIYYPDNLLALFPIRLFTPFDLAVELGREAATIVMLLAMSLLAEREFRRRLAVFLFLFGIWDIFYYLWLKATIGWPVSWTEWDILFLIPWAWLAPWITPASIALLFVLWGWRALDSPGTYRITAPAAALFLLGSALALASFLEPAFPLLRLGPEAVAGFEPEGYRWAWFLPGYLMIAAGMTLTLVAKPTADLNKTGSAPILSTDETLP